MNVIILLILASLGVALLFLAGFVWAVRSGQFEDTLTPAMRVLAEERSGQAGGEAAPEPASEQTQARRNPKQTK
jgi:cbb3-type cytochrome oxidase maturation protein